MKFSLKKSLTKPKWTLSYKLQKIPLISIDAQKNAKVENFSTFLMTKDIINNNAIIEKIIKNPPKFSKRLNAAPVFFTKTKSNMGFVGILFIAILKIKFEK